MTAATGFKRLGIAIAAIVLASFAALGADVASHSDRHVREQATAEIRNVTGLDLVLRGDVDRLAVSDRLDQLRRRDARRRSGKPALAADRLTARLRFLPLLPAASRSPTCR